MAARLVAAASVVVGATALGGCGLQRALVVDSSPSGAKLWVNGVEHGATPQRIPYVYDGLFTLRLEKNGYESFADEVVTKTETDAVIGPDFFAENFGARRERVTRRHYDLVPLRRTPPTQAELEAALADARAFRKRTATEIAEPGTPAPTRPHPAPSDAPPAGR